jgi:hypothetical protein
MTGKAASRSKVRSSTSRILSSRHYGESIVCRHLAILLGRVGIRALLQSKEQAIASALNVLTHQLLGLRAVTFR